MTSPRTYPAITQKRLEKRRTLNDFVYLQTYQPTSLSHTFDQIDLIKLDRTLEHKCKRHAEARVMSRFNTFQSHKENSNKRTNKIHSSNQSSNILRKSTFFNQTLWTFTINLYGVELFGPSKSILIEFRISSHSLWNRSFRPSGRTCQLTMECTIMKIRRSALRGG